MCQACIADKQKASDHTCLKNPRWGQENPRDQLRVILGAIEMDLHNIAHGLRNERQIPRITQLLQDCQVLAESLPPGEWKKAEQV